MGLLNAAVDFLILKLVGSLAECGAVRNDGFQIFNLLPLGICRQKPEGKAVMLDGTAVFCFQRIEEFQVLNNTTLFYPVIRLRIRFLTFS